MASLSEVYRDGPGGADRRRLYAGLALFAAGTTLTVAGIVVATAAGTTGAFGMGLFAARELAGVFAGVGLPATFLGAVTVLPRASPRLRGAAGVGAATALLAVVLFVDVYPQRWFANAGVVLATYFVGALTALWCLFVAVANYKARNDPGGTVNFQVTKEGRTRVIEVPATLSGLGGVGLLGGTPDTDAPTQTNRPDADTTTDGGSSAEVLSTGSDPDPGPPTPDGAAPRDDAEVTGDSAPGVSRVDTTPSRTGAGGGPRADPAAGREDGTELVGGDEVVGDPYCGNCANFNYVRTDEGLQPYCGYHDEIMDDMEACRQWEPTAE